MPPPPPPPPWVRQWGDGRNTLQWLERDERRQTDRHGGNGDSAWLEKNDFAFKEILRWRMVSVGWSSPWWPGEYRMVSLKCSMELRKTIILTRCIRFEIVESRTDSVNSNQSTLSTRFLVNTLAKQWCRSFPPRAGGSRPAHYRMDTNRRRESRLASMTQVFNWSHPSTSTKMMNWILERKTQWRFLEEERDEFVMNQKSSLST